MAQKSIELILLRQLINYLTLPICLIDPNGNLIYLNEAAEKIFGLKFSETGELSATEWSTIFIPYDQKNNPLPPDSLPLFITHRQHRPAHGSFYIMNLQNKIWHVETFTLPIINQSNDFLGTVAIFQELET